MHSNALTKTPCLQYHQQISQSSKQIAVKISLKAKKKQINGMLTNTAVVGSIKRTK